MITKNLTVRGLARKSYFLIKSKRNWCQGRHSEDEGGEMILYQCFSAYRFCADGALLKIMHEARIPITSPIRDDVLEIIEKIYKKSLVKINDKDGHEAVLTALKKIGWGKW